MFRPLAVAAAVSVFGLAAQATPVVLGDLVDFDVLSTSGPAIDTSFTVINGIDFSFGSHTVDVDVGGTDGLLITVSPNTGFCGIITCTGGITSFVLSDLDFVGGESLVGFVVSGATSIFVGFDILSDSSISFNFTDTSFNNGDSSVFVAGTFVTRPSVVPLPAAGGLLLAGLGLMGTLRLRSKRAPAVV